jgi:hypothetical protein
VWSNPELTWQHVDPQTSLAPNQRALFSKALSIKPCKKQFRNAVH